MRRTRFFLLLTVMLISPLLPAERGSSYPYLSGDTFRTRCQFSYDELHSMDPRQVKDGDWVFLKTDYLERFFFLVHPYIENRYVLITHNSDMDIPVDFVRYLDEGKIIAWFGQNAKPSLHPKLFPIPIGIANRCWRHGNIWVIKAMQDRYAQVTKTINLYLNIQPSTYPSERNRVIQLFKNKPFCTEDQPKEFCAYLGELARSKYVLAPRGNGVDTHRMWEALLMGAIPIVKTSYLDSMLEGLPVLIVKDWEEITEEFLQKNYEEIYSKKNQLEKVYAEYWLDYIQSTATALSHL